MNTKKIVHVLHSFGFGGLEKGIATVVRHGNPDFEHVILCLSQTGESQALLPDGSRVVELHKREGSSPRFLYDLARKLRGMEPDVVHTRNWGGMDGIIAANLAGLKRRVVQGEHGWGMEDVSGQNKKRLWVRRLLARGVREFTCVSVQMQEWLQDRVKVRRPVTQIYNGIDTSRFSSSGDQAPLHQELGLSPGTRVIVAVGRLDPIKDHAGLIKAFEQVRQSYPDCALAIVGDGPEWERLAAHDVPRVHLLGARGDIPEILRSADVFALASINEGISNTILEAMATGLPVVSTNVGGTPELITHEENGFLADPRDVEGVASYLLTYLRDRELRAEHGHRNRRRAEQRFSIEAMVQGYEQVWRRVAEKSS